MSSAPTHLAYTRYEGNGKHRQKIRPVLPLDASVYAFKGGFCAYVISSLYLKVIVLAQYIKQRNAIIIGHQLVEPKWNILSSFSEHTSTKRNTPPPKPSQNS